MTPPPRPRIRRRPREEAELAIALAALVAFALLAESVAHDDRPSRLDRRIARRLRPLLDHHTDALLTPLDLLGYPAAYVPLAVAAGEWMRRRGHAHGRLLPVGALAGWAAHRAAKLVYDRPRPRTRPGRRRKRSSSFPSGHTTGAAALCATAALSLHRDGVLRLREAILLGAGAPAVMGASRVLLEWHWATDVIGGWLLGGATALAVDALGALTGRRRHSR